MFGELALSERAIASHGILNFGSVSADSSFVMSSDFANFQASGSLSLEAISSISRIGAGTLTGTIGVTSEFEQSANALRFATGIVEKSFGFVADTDGILVKNGISEQSFDFTQNASGIRFASGVSEQSFDFIQSLSANALYSGISSQFFDFIQSSEGSRVLSGAYENFVEFAFVQTAGILIYRNNFNVEFAFVQTINGDLLWVEIDANTPVETWSQINASGGTWTPINASGTIEQWIKKVV
tara:strand:- start:1512 stop:2234 length:723 start_codon:yes stop_codon:yes gene_type:complete